MPLLAQDGFIQVQILQECVGGMNKLRVLPITPSSNVNEYSYEFSSYKLDGETYLGELVKGSNANEFSVKEPPAGTFSHYTIRVKRSGYADFVLNWYSTRCQHDNTNAAANPTNCPENTRVITPNKQYYTAGETIKINYSGCPTGIKSYGTGFMIDTPDKPDWQEYWKKVTLSGNTLTAPVVNQPLTISIFCGGTGECHGYTTFSLVPDGFNTRDVPTNTFLRIKNQGSGKYLVPSDKIGENILQAGYTNELWKLVKVEEPNVYKFISQMGNLAMESINSYAVSSRNIADIEAQKWYINYFLDGTIRIRSKNYPNSSLEIAAESDNIGSPLYLGNGNPSKSISYFKYSLEFLDIQTANPGKIAYSAGETVSLTYDANFAPNKLNFTGCGFYDKSVMELQLSEGSGSWNTATVIGKSIMDNADLSGKFSISGIIPTNLSRGDNYHLRVARTQMQRNPKGTANCVPAVPTIIDAYQNVYGNQNSQGLTIGCPINLSVTDNFLQGVSLKEGEAISTTSTVSAAAQLKLKAAKVVDLQQGFDASKGSGFDAELGGCQNN